MLKKWVWKGWESWGVWAGPEILQRDSRKSQVLSSQSVFFICKVNRKTLFVKNFLKLCFQQTRCWHNIPGGCGSEHDWSWIRLDCHRAGHTLVTIIVTRDMWHYRLCTRPIFPMVLSDSTWQAQTTRRLTSTTHCKMRRKLYIILCFFRQPHPGQRDQDPVWQGGGRRGSPEQL